MSGPRLKRLRYRAWHRGTRELDLILGTYVDGALETMGEGDIESFETVLNASDPDLYDWIVGGAEPEPAIDRALIERLRAHVASGAAGIST